MRFLAPLAFAVMLAVSTIGLATDALGGPEWCEDDPVFVVNGAILDVTTAFPAENVGDIKDPIEFELVVPENVTAAVVSLPGAVPATATITYSLPAYSGIGGIPVVVNVTVKASAHFETLTRVTGAYTTSDLAGQLDGSAPDAGVSTVQGKSNVTTQVGYSLLGL